MNSIQYFISRFLPYRGQVISAMIIAILFAPCLSKSQLTRLTFSELSRNGHFGKKLDVHEDHIVVAEPNYSDTSYLHAGRVHIFRRESGNWIHDGILENDAVKSYSHFGYDLSIHSDELAISAPDQGPGSVFIYRRNGFNWELTQEIHIPSDLHRETPHIKFGDNIEKNDEWLAIRATGYLGNSDSITRTGAVFIFKNTGDTWAFHQMLLPPDLSQSTQFGNDIELENSSILISAVKGEGGTQNSGVVYLYSLEGDQWVADYTFINPKSRSHELFGADADIYENTIAIGAPMHTADEAQGPVGAVHVFQKFEDTWIRTALLEASDGKRNDMFGSTVAVEAGNIFVGAPRHDEPGQADVGKVYHYVVQNAFWSEKTTYSPSIQDIQAHMHFGGTLSLDNHQIAIGGHLMNNVLDDSGIAYTTDVEVITSTNEDEQLTGAAILISPNPASDLLNVTINEVYGPDLSFTIYSQDGRSVLRKDSKIPSPGISNPIDVSSLPPGIYFLHIMNGERISLHKWMKV